MNYLVIKYKISEWTARLIIRILPRIILSEIALQSIVLILTDHYIEDSTDGKWFDNVNKHYQENKPDEKLHSFADYLIISCEEYY